MEVKETLDRILDLTGDLAETQKDLIVVKFIENSTKAASVTVLGVIMFALATLVLLFAGLGLAWWIGMQMGDLKWGFFIVGAMFIVLLLILLLLSRGVFLPIIRNWIVNMVYDDSEL